MDQLTRTLMMGAAGANKLYVDEVFSTYLYTGNGGSQSIVNNVDLAGSGGMLWIKARSSATYGHYLFDSVRGLANVAGQSALSSHLTNAAPTEVNVSFTPSGFSLAGAGNGDNINAVNYVSWAFRRAPKFFDVVTWTGDGVNGRNVPHGLGVSPGLVIIKKTTSASNWTVFHQSLGGATQLVLNSNIAAAAQTGGRVSSVTSTHFVLTAATDYSLINEVGSGYVAYLFADDTSADGIIQCGSFTTDGTGAGSGVTNWEPQFVMIKSVGVSGDWHMADTTRGMLRDGNGSYIFANTAAAEVLGSTAKGTAQGFNVTGFSASQNYVYMAIRRPNKTPSKGTQVFAPATYTGGNQDNGVPNLKMGTNTIDMVWIRQRDSTTVAGFVVGDRLRGNTHLLTGSSAVQVSDDDTLMTPTVGYGNAFSGMGIIGVGNDLTSLVNSNTTALNHIAYSFKRAPGFFDARLHTGNGANRTISHALGAVPELMIVKGVTTGTLWLVGGTIIPATDYLSLNLENGKATNATLWNSTHPTDAVFSLGTGAEVNQNGAIYVAYLFATLPGVSKVGTYTGNGAASQVIDCGFTTGARFVLLKARDVSDAWRVFDTERGIVAGNDPFLVPNSTASEFTTFDALDPNPVGFEVTNNTGMNANGAVYIYLAIA